jgi:hypothetical protein
MEVHYLTQNKGNATLDVHKMRQTIIDNTNSIEELKGKGEKH